MLASSTTWACECIVRSVAEQYADSSAVFLAEVVEATPLCRASQSKAGKTACGGPIVSRLKPYEVYKQHWKLQGDPKAGLREVYVAGDDSNCAVWMQVGKKYLVFADNAKNSSLFLTSQCAGTVEATSASAALRKLQILKAAFDNAEKP